MRWQCGRSCAPPPARVAGNPLVDAVEAGLLALPVERLAQDLADCGTVTSGLGHPIGAKGVFGPPQISSRPRFARAVADTLSFNQTAASNRERTCPNRA